MATTTTTTTTPAKPLRICVFGSSRATTKESYKTAAEQFGRLLSQAGHINNNGAGRFGCMGACNKGSLSVEGAVVEGVIHKMWMPEGDKDELQTGMTTLHVADGPTLTQRKEMLCAGSDGFVVLPGGPGTFDELWEVISEFQLGLPKGKCPRPVCLVNVEGYYDPTVMQLQRCFDDGMLYKEVTDVVHCEPTAEKALAYIVAAIGDHRTRFAAAADSKTVADDVVLSHISDELRKSTAQSSTL